MIVKCLVLTSLLLGSVTADAERAPATAQQPDIIQLEGKTYPLLVNPLAPYLAQNPEKRPRREVMSTANWRGYVAHFAIVDRRLMLTDVRIDLGRGDGSDRSVMTQVFPDSTSVMATWFTGNLIIPDGQRVSYVHLGYGSGYERYRVVRVEHGVAAAPRELSHDEFATFRRARFDAFKTTAEYADILRKENADQALRTPAEVEGFMYHFAVAEYMARM